VLDWRKREPTWPIRRKSAYPLPLEKRLNRITLDSDFKLQRSLIFACSTLPATLVC
jgi:hypothetical protein